MPKRPHLWGPSRVGHGTQQCRLCLCTYEEAHFALGQECPKNVAEVVPAPPLAHPGPLTPKGRVIFATNLDCMMQFSNWKRTGVIK